MKIDHPFDSVANIDGEALTFDIDQVGCAGK